MITKELAIELGAQWGKPILYHYVQQTKNGMPMRAWVTGKTKTWKRSPDKWYLPIARSLYDNARIGPEGNVVNVHYREWCWSIWTPKERAQLLAQTGLSADTPDIVLRDKAKEMGLIAMESSR